MIRRIILYILLNAIFATCKNNSSEQSYVTPLKKWDTLIFINRTFISPFINKAGSVIDRIKIINSNGRCKLVEGIKYNVGNELYKNITFDIHKDNESSFMRERCMYSYDNGSKIFADTITSNEAILLKTEYDPWPRKKEAYYYFYWNNWRLKEIEEFKNFKYLSNNLSEDNDKLCRSAEFIVPYYKSNKLLFSYHNYKAYIYKKDQFCFCILYVKNDILKQDILSTEEQYKNSFEFERIIDEVKIYEKDN